MNSKDLIKYGLIALGAYLIYEYIQKNGGLSGIFGTTAAAGGTGTLTAAQIAAANAAAAAAANTGGGTTTGGGGTTTNTTPPVLDMTGLAVHPDVNSSLTGVVKINGIPTTLSIITASGAIYDSSGNEVTSELQSEGIDVVALRTAFANAAPAAASTSTASLAKCAQPNYFQGGVCVDPFTGQPISNTMSQSQQNGVAGLGAVRFTPPWLM
jgi:hypothetical protein